MKVRNRIMIFVGILLTFVGITIIFFNISYSKTKNEFKILNNILTTKASKTNEVFTSEDIKNLPSPVQRFFNHCGYIGKPKMTYMKATFKDVSFSLGRNKPTIKIDYTQYNLANEPMRLAYIDSSMYGIPFQGLDSYVNGSGKMKGVIAKLFTLFEQQGAAMDRASLATYLAECFVIPSVALQDFIAWEEIDDTHAKATISYRGVSAGGIFTFNEEGEMLLFETYDRENTSMDGTIEKVKWTAICDDYKEINGILLPTKFQAVWNYKEGDLLYFDGRNIEFEYGVN